MDHGGKGKGGTWDPGKLSGCPRPSQLGQPREHSRCRAGAGAEVEEDLGGAGAGAEEDEEEGAGVGISHGTA